MAKWYQEGDDWGEGEEIWNKIDNFSAVVLDKINILDILDKYEIEYYAASSGNFTHKLKCPFSIHLGGSERTASLCVSGINNDFHCFGCNSNGNSITFMMLYLGIPYSKALELLAKYCNISESDVSEDFLQPREKTDPNHMILPHISKAGVLIRDFIKNKKDSKDYSKWCNWANNKFTKLDYYLDTLNDEQWKIVKDYCDRLEKFLDKKVG